MTNKDRYQQARFTVSTFIDDVERKERADIRQERVTLAIYVICAILALVTLLVY